MEQVIAELSTYLRGWINYFGLSDYYRPIPGLDNWIRRRVRMCYWKQWKRPKTRIRTLLKLGTNRKHAVSTGRSSKGYWRLSKTLATQSGMTNLWLAHQGLVSLKKPLDIACSTSMNRPVRDPHAGWCGRGKRKASLYPIGPVFADILYETI
ncbi:MAG: hypothetical protein HQM11_19430 [SAR324 cluster bacterium]|nr:hypothetical protein [SAR324 cluster bacterium]